MSPKRNPTGKSTSNSNPKGKKSEPKRKTAPSAPRRLLAEQQQQNATASKGKGPQDETNENAEIDLSAAIASIPVSLQQLLLNVFRTALLPDTTSSSEPEENDLHTQIQTLKAHLYNRDFVSAFADASPELLRAYALRWSASRCLAYVGIFKGVVPALLDNSLALRRRNLDNADSKSNSENGLRVLCIGGGAGAEIVALAGVWRALLDEYDASSTNEKQIDETEESVDSNLEKLSLTVKDALPLPKLNVTAVDVAEWSNVVDSLSKTIRSTTVLGQKSCPPPLLKDSSENAVDISFRHLDVLSLSEPDFSSLLSPHDAPKTNLISLMFTLNELFSTSMPKTTQLLLRITDETDPGTILLIVDSPGSYSTLSIGGESAKQRQYPMKFLLEHTLLTVAQGKWEKMLSQDSRWFRREASKLTYSVNLEGGDGLVKLEDMRYQIHVYRRLSSEVK